jgi:hypothetical protein
VKHNVVSLMLKHEECILWIVPSLGYLLVYHILFLYEENLSKWKMYCPYKSTSKFKIDTFSRFGLSYKEICITTAPMELESN